VRYRVKNAPFRTGVCHCTFCRRRTRGVAGGTFDDPSWLKIERHTWTRSCQHWVPIPPEVTKFEKSSVG
jgi:hypothetical protein